jgi:hypothetical protein
MFQQFQIYVASVLSEYFKSRSNVATRDPPAIVACYSCWDDIQAEEVEGAQRASGPRVGSSDAAPCLRERRSVDAGIWMRVCPGVRMLAPPILKIN